MPLLGGLYLSFIRVIATLLLVASLPAVADCFEPRAPAFPNIESADLSNMEAAQANMRRYIKLTEDYLECLSADQQTQKIDAVLTTMKQVTAEYNALVNAYRKRKAQELFIESEE